MQINTKTRAQIAQEYKISPRTLNRRMTKLKLEIPKISLLLPSSVKLIYEALGYPESIMSNNVQLSPIKY